jgi:hypothetical protein
MDSSTNSTLPFFVIRTSHGTFYFASHADAERFLLESKTWKIAVPSPADLAAFPLYLK